MEVALHARKYDMIEIPEIESHNPKAEFDHNGQQRTIKSVTDDETAYILFRMHAGVGESIRWLYSKYLQPNAPLHWPVDLARPLLAKQMGYELVDINKLRYLRIHEGELGRLSAEALGEFLSAKLARSVWAAVGTALDPLCFAKTLHYFYHEDLEPPDTWNGEVVVERFDESPTWGIYVRHLAEAGELLSRCVGDRETEGLANMAKDEWERYYDVWRRCRRLKGGQK